MRNLTFNDALKMQKILKKSNIFTELQEKTKNIKTKNNTEYGYEILSILLEILINNFDKIEDEFIEFIEEIHQIRNFRELEIDKAFELIIEIKNNKSFESFFTLLGKKTK